MFGHGVNTDDRRLGGMEWIKGRQSKLHLREKIHELTLLAPSFDRLSSDLADKNNTAAVVDTKSTLIPSLRSVYIVEISCGTTILLCALETGHFLHGGITEVGSWAWAQQTMTRHAPN